MLDALDDSQGDPIVLSQSSHDGTGVGLHSLPADLGHDVLSQDSVSQGWIRHEGLAYQIITVCLRGSHFFVSESQGAKRSDVKVLRLKGFGVSTCRRESAALAGFCFTHRWA